MVAIGKPPIHYPSGDGQPMADMFDHFQAKLEGVETELKAERAMNQQMQANLLAQRSANEVLQQQLQESQTQIDRYRDRFGDL
jgi:septal ring factor EnvC (AmiA/AmiB activator)